MVRDTQSAPGAGGGTFLNLGSSAFNAFGNLIFDAQLSGTSDGSTEGEGVCIRIGTTIDESMCCIEIERLILCVVEFDPGVSSGKITASF